MSGIDEQPCNTELAEWNHFVQGYLQAKLYLGPSKARIAAEFFVGILIFGILDLFIKNLMSGLFSFLLIILGVMVLYVGGRDLGKYLGWRANFNRWFKEQKRRKSVAPY